MFAALSDGPPIIPSRFPRYPGGTPSEMRL
jgi:hypothetical protein